MGRRPARSWHVRLDHMTVSHIEVESTSFCAMINQKTPRLIDMVSIYSFGYISVDSPNTRNKTAQDF